MTEEKKGKTSLLHGKKVNIMTILNEGEKSIGNSEENQSEKLPNYDEVKTGKYTDLVKKENQESERENSKIRLHHMMVIHKPPLENTMTEAVNDACEVNQRMPEKVETNEKIAPKEQKKKLSCCSCLLVSEHPLPATPSMLEQCWYAMLCPPHDCLGSLLTYLLAVLTVWGVAYCVLGQVAWYTTEDINVTIKGGTVFALLVMLVVAFCAGWLLERVRMPPLLGMLLTGIVLKNVPPYFAAGVDPEWYAATRSTALVVILLRACLGLNPAILKQLSAMVFRLAFMPCIAEATAVALASYVCLGLPWIWGFMLGFILAAVSPAVVVSCLLSLQDRGFGVVKGIPTLVIAAASMDDVLAISCFTILLGITFNDQPNLALLILHGPLEIVVAVVWGLLWGILITFLPPQPNPNPILRLLLLGGGALLALFGSDLIHLKGAGALAILVMAFTAGVGWRSQGWGDSNPVTESLAKLWIFFQPLLFSLIGAEIDLSALSPHTMAWGLLVVLCGLIARALAAFLAVGGGQNNKKERLFVALAWMPKATVQAAMGPLALGKVRDALASQHPGQDCTTGLEPQEESLAKLCTFLEYGHQLLTIAVMVILLTAPIGAIAITLTGPKLLHNDSDGNNETEEKEEA